MTSVFVLAPNGRRQTVKCSPNTTILQIIEEVCRKQGFKAEEYDIKHHNKVLDTTQTMRFSGLPNNAQLELADALKVRSESDVMLAINLENGERIMGSFTPSVSLLDVLKQLYPESVEPNKSPIVIYTRREIYGSELEKVTLRSLGLTGGRAMVRLIFRSPEELKNQANISAPIPAKPVEEKPYHRTLQKIEPDECKPDTNLKTENTGAIKKNDKGESMNQKTHKPAPLQQHNNYDLMKLAKEKRKREENIENLQKAGAHLNPAVKVAPSAPSTSKGEVKDVGLKPDRKNISVEKSGPKLESSNSTDDEFVFIGSRNAMLFSLETAQSVPSEDLPDDFFELTINDAKKILRDIKRKRLEIENTPMMTSTLRNLEESKKQLNHLNRYNKAIIRVQFPNRAVLQGTFQPVDTVAEVINFVKEYLENKTLDFYLYTTPPKCILNNNSRLMEINCVPGALLHFGTTNLNMSEQYLRKDLLNKFTTTSMARIAASKMRLESTRSIDATQKEEESDMDVTENNQSLPGPSSARTTDNYDTYERKVVPSKEKVPKWFKTTK